MTTVETHRPLPDVDWPETAEFWAGCKRHELLLPRCRNCGKFRWYPRPMCHICQSLEWDWVPVSGKGKVWSFVVVRRAFDAGLTGELPLISAQVMLDEDNEIHFITLLKECTPEEVYIDMPVEVKFVDIEEKVSLPFFRPAIRK